MRVQIVEDNPKLRAGLADFLGLEGYACETFDEGHSALAAFEARPYEIVLLDVMLPGIDGFDLCRRYRAQAPDAQILMLSARGEAVDRRMGLELGADDYVAKPFDPGELKARVAAMARRIGQNRPSQKGFVIGDLRVDPVRLMASRGSCKIELNSREISILKLLADNVGCPVSRDSLYDVCWGRSYFANSRALDQYISSLRHKIEKDPQSPLIIQTVRGIGYRFRPSA